MNLPRDFVRMWCQDFFLFLADSFESPLAAAVSSVGRSDGLAVKILALLSDQKAAVCWWSLISFSTDVSLMLLHFSLDTVFVFQKPSPLTMYILPFHSLVREIQGCKITLLPQMETIYSMQMGVKATGYSFIHPYVPGIFTEYFLCQVLF